MSQFLPLIRDRLSVIATTTATAADALADGEALDLDAHTLAELLLTLDGQDAQRLCRKLVLRQGMA
jgi:hypothetical protein